MARAIGPLWRIRRRRRLGAGTGRGRIRPFRFELRLGDACEPARSMTVIAVSTPARRKGELERQLAALPAAPTGCDRAPALRAEIGRARPALHLQSTIPAWSKPRTTRRCAGGARARTSEKSPAAPRHLGWAGRSGWPSDHRRPGSSAAKAANPRSAFGAGKYVSSNMILYLIPISTQ